MYEPVETYEHAGIEVKIFPDHDCEHADPRDMDNPVILACYHPNYNLGDSEHELPRDGLEEIECTRCNGYGYFKNLRNEPDCKRCEGTGRVQPTLHEWAKDQGALAIAPLFILDHSGITMRAGRTVLVNDEALTQGDTESRNRFMGDEAGWDTSMVGFAIITNESWKPCMGDEPVTLEKATEVIDSEVKTYASYLEGSVYGYVVADGELGEDACWGFLGDPDESGCKEEANHAAKHAADLQAQEANERSEMAARDIETVAA
jgi:hypothetical protein